MWDLPRPGLEPVCPALAGRFSTTAPPGKPLDIFWRQSQQVLLKDPMWGVREGSLKWHMFFLTWAARSVIWSVREFVGIAGLGGKPRSSLLDVLYLRCPSKVVGSMSLKFRGKDGTRDGHWESSAYGCFLKTWNQMRWSLARGWRGRGKKSCLRLSLGRSNIKSQLMRRSQQRRLRSLEEYSFYVVRYVKCLLHELYCFYAHLVILCLLTVLYSKDIAN